MMRAISIRLKVTIWYTLLVAVLAGMAILSVAFARDRVEMRYYRETLESTAKLAADDIALEDGEIVIDRNLDEMANVRAAVYDKSGDLIYGKTRFDADFDEGKIYRVSDRAGGHWYVKDTLVKTGGGDVWLRLYIASDASEAMNTQGMLLMLVLAPVIVILAAAGGWAITRAAFKPVVHISRTAESIMDGRDLEKRVALPAARDEIFQLAKVMDTMLERLEASFERERRFTSDAAHELRTPIAAIMAQSEMGLEGGDMEAALRDIRGRAAGMSALVGELLALTRMAEGRAKVEMEMVDAAEICRAVAEITDCGAEVMESGDCAVLCDQSMITRAVMNVVENAVKYAGAESGIGIYVSGLENEVRIEVRDGGPGIADEDIGHIFERFYQGDKARSGQGAGLGLAMVKQIMTLHGGGVSVKNDGGAVFTMALPRKGE